MRSDDIESLLARGHRARREGRSGDAERHFAEAVALSRESGDASALAQSLKGLAQVERDQGKREAALEHYQEAVGICRTLDDALLLAHTIRHVADIQRELQLHAEAGSSYTEALSIYRSHSETKTLDLANTLRGYAILQATQGRNTEAIALWEEAGHLYDQVWREPGSPYKESDLAPGVAESKKQIALLSAS